MSPLALLPSVSVLSSWELQQWFACKLYLQNKLPFVEFGWKVTAWWPVKGGYQLCFHVDLEVTNESVGPPAFSIGAIIMEIAAMVCLQIVLAKQAIIC